MNLADIAGCSFNSSETCRWSGRTQGINSLCKNRYCIDDSSIYSVCKCHPIFISSNNLHFLVFFCYLFASKVCNLFELLVVLYSCRTSMSMIWLQCVKEWGRTLLVFFFSLIGYENFQIYAWELIILNSLINYCQSGWPDTNYLSFGAAW